MSNFILDDPNIDTTNLSPEQIDFSYLITGNPKKRTIIFRPELLSICKGSVWAVLLFDQLYYYLERKAEKENKPITSVEIFKFLSPCNHPLYKKGDSFCEELQITERKFRTAIQKIGFKYNWKTTEQEIKQSKSLILYKKDKNNVTRYKLNPFILSNHNSKKNSSKFSNLQNVGSRDCKKSIRYNRDYITENTSFNSSSEESKGLNNNKLVAKQLNKKKRISDQGTLRVEAAASNLQRKGKLNGKDSLVKKKIKSLPKLKKIIVPDNPLHKFGFPLEVFEILNHWKSLGGKIPKDPNRRKIANQISHQIQELLLPGNNPYTPVLNDKELNQFRTKKWTVQEIKDTITYYAKKLHKPIEQITFLQFILFRNYQKKEQKDYSPLVMTFQQLPQQLSFLAKKIKDDFTSHFPEIHFYDKSFINIANFLENKLIEYKSIQTYGNISFDIDQINDLFYHYMYEKVKPKGEYEELKYMSKEQNLKEFIYWCVDCNLIKKRTNKELNTYKKDLKEQYKLQIEGYQKDIDNDNLELWDQSRWDYFEYMKSQLQELSTC